MSGTKSTARHEAWRVEMARAEWDRLVAEAQRPHGVGFAEREADTKAPRETVTWYATAGAVLQENEHPIEQLRRDASVQVARHRELLRNGADGWAVAMDAMRRWAYQYDTYYEPRPWSWSESEVTNFIEVRYPGGVEGFIAANGNDDVRRPAEVDEFVAMGERALRDWQSRWISALLNVASDATQPAQLRAIASRRVLGEDIDAE